MKNASMMVTYDIQLIPSHGRALMKELGMEPRTYYERPILDEINALGDFKESKTYKVIMQLEQQNGCDSIGDEIRWMAREVEKGKWFSPRTEPVASIDSDDLNSRRHEEQETVVLLPAGLGAELVIGPLNASLLLLNLNWLLGKSYQKMRFLYPSRLEKWILRTIGERWRQYKSNLKALYFDASKNMEVNCSNAPQDVIKDQWIALVNNWMTSKAKEISDTNRKNCAKKKSTHTAGTKSFARNKEEMRRQSYDDYDDLQRPNKYSTAHKSRENATTVDNGLQSYRASNEPHNLGNDV
ncbi:hypothetical protein E2562_010556 [Oryza meyeriana var. granulata]|uniref:Uncharacterized protein n=1 Tax=Oryza meyeriana var. granulata TaxID=110450 RepID=A0A6G1BUQ4_9ORYZ|nr:hypothetical protein E2562_010556 [Oryza meyeriana var. granulata]